METTCGEVLRTFHVTPQAQQLYHDWENNEERRTRGVIETVRNHITRVPYQLSAEDFDRLKENHERNNDHPLRDIRFEDIKDIKKGIDWEPAFAFVHLFHFLTEDLGRLPGWTECSYFFCQDETGRRILGEERETKEQEIYLDELEKLRAKYPAAKGIEHRAKMLAKDSLDWRVGLAYYGFTREMYTVVKLRERGLDLRVHPLADALFRADAWVNRNIISIYVLNPNFKGDLERSKKKQAGRKRTVESIYGNATPRFNFVPITLERAGHADRGKFYFPTDQALDEAEQTIRTQSTEI